MKCVRPAIAVLAVASMGVPARAQMTYVDSFREIENSFTVWMEGSDPSTGGGACSGPIFVDCRSDFCEGSRGVTVGVARHRAGWYACVIPEQITFNMDCELEVGGGDATKDAWVEGNGSTSHWIRFELDEESDLRIHGSLSMTQFPAFAAIELQNLDTQEYVLQERVPSVRGRFIVFDRRLSLPDGLYECRFETEFEPLFAGRFERWLATSDIDFSIVAVCLADFDGSGELDVMDFLAYQVAFDAGDLATDLDGDGTLTIFDFLAFSNAFEDGCD